jgi:hypothetical protein
LQGRSGLHPAASTGNGDAEARSRDKLSSTPADLVAQKEDKVGKWLAEDKKAITWLRKEVRNTSLDM